MVHLRGLDFLKFVFAVLIVLFHSRMLTACSENWIVVNGRIGVEFFFMVSGYLMCVSCEKSEQGNIGIDTWQFMWKKVRRLMPNFIIAWFIMFCVYHYNAGITETSKIFINFVRSVPELLLIKNSGIRFPSYNGPTWYLSAMLLNMLVLYPLLKKLKDLFYVLALALMLFILGNFYQEFGTLSDLESWNGWFLKGTIRGTAGLLGGTLCYKMSALLRSNKYTNCGKICFMLIEWFSYIVAIILCCLYPPSRLDYLIFALFMVGITITCSNISFDAVVFQHEIFTWLGTFSFSLYLGHSCWREFTYNIYPNYWGFNEKLICYLIASVWSALLVHYISVFLILLKEEKWQKLKAVFIESC